MFWMFITMPIYPREKNAKRLRMIIAWTVRFLTFSRTESFIQLSWSSNNKRWNSICQMYVGHPSKKTPCLWWKERPKYHRLFCIIYQNYPSNQAYFFAYLPKIPLKLSILSLHIYQNYPSNWAFFLLHYLPKIPLTFSCFFFWVVKYLFIIC